MICIPTYIHAYTQIWKLRLGFFSQQCLGFSESALLIVYLWERKEQRGWVIMGARQKSGANLKRFEPTELPAKLLDYFL